MPNSTHVASGQNIRWLFYWKEIPSYLYFMAKKTKKKKPIIVMALAGPPPEVAVVWVWPASSPALGAIFLLQLTT